MPTVQFQEIKNGTNFDKKQLCEGNKNFDKFEELFVYGFQRYIDFKKISLINMKICIFMIKVLSLKIKKK